MFVRGGWFQEGGRLVCYVACERCSSLIGALEPGEMAALSTGKYGKVLCFDCEEKSCPDCQKEMSSRDIVEAKEGGYSECWFCHRLKEQAVQDDYLLGVPVSGGMGLSWGAGI